MSFLNKEDKNKSQDEVDTLIAKAIYGASSNITEEQIWLLLDEVRAHERHELEKSENDKFLERLKLVCQEYDRDTGVYPDPQSVGEEIYFQEIDKIKDDEKRIKLQKEYYDEMGWKY